MVFTCGYDQWNMDKEKVHGIWIVLYKIQRCKIYLPVDMINDNEIWIQKEHGKWISKWIIWAVFTSGYDQGLF